MGYDLRKSPYKCLSCQTRQQECYCCDTGNDRGQFTITMAGCEGLAGMRTVDLYRYRSPQVIATGVSYPATNPCGVFWGTTSNGAGCTAGGTSWGGSIGFLNWCDGTDAAIPWHVEVYCYNADTSTWVSQGEATVTLFECRCGGPYLEFTLPTLDCCCDGGGGPTNCAELEALGVPIVADDGTNQITLTYDSGLGYWTYSGAGTFAGCTDGSWVWQCVDAVGGYFAHAPSGQSCGPAGTISPFDMSCTFFGCDGNPYSVTFTE